MHLYLSSTFRIPSRDVYTHFSSYAITESKLPHARRSGVGRYFRDEVTQGPSDVLAPIEWCVHLSRPRKSQGAGV